jgi:hypothetical protein
MTTIIFIDHANNLIIPYINVTTIPRFGLPGSGTAIASGTAAMTHRDGYSGLFTRMA